MRIFTNLILILISYNVFSYTIDDYAKDLESMSAKEKQRFYNEISDFLENKYNSRYSLLIKKQANKMLDPFLVYNGDLEKYARECLWWGRRAERFFV